MPVATSVVITDANTLTFTGTNFFTSGYTGQATFGGVAADSVAITSPTEAVATFLNGIPLVTVAQLPSLSFVSQTSQAIHWASVSTTITNTLSANSIAQSASCSFAGGCLIKVNQPGLYASLLSNSTTNSLQVCNQVCTLSPADSTTGVT